MYKQFLLFPQYFQKASFQDSLKGVIVWEWFKCFCLWGGGGERVEIYIQGNVVTLTPMNCSYVIVRRLCPVAICTHHCQATNFGLSEMDFADKNFRCGKTGRKFIELKKMWENQKLFVSINFFCSLNHIL